MSKGRGILLVSERSDWVEYKEIQKKIAEAVTKIWSEDIPYDYETFSLLKEDALKCAIYHHLRSRLEAVLCKNNLRIFPEYYIEELKYRADIAIVRINPANIKPKLKDMVTDVIAIFELKYDCSKNKSTTDCILKDVDKIRIYVKEMNKDCHYYFACINEVEMDSLKWFSEQDVNSWAKNKVTELDAGYVDGYMEFEVNSY